MQGYYKDAEATANAIDAQGWFHTGDLARLDAKGRISVRGRVKNVIVLPTGKTEEALEGQAHKTSVHSLIWEANVSKNCLHHISGCAARPS